MNDDTTGESQPQRVGKGCEATCEALANVTGCDTLGEEE